MQYDVCTQSDPALIAQALHASAAEFVLLCAGGTLGPGAQAALEEAVAAPESSKTALFELRRFPLEQTKLYDPIRCESVYADLGGCLVRRSAFEAVGGFDEAVFPDAMQVDFCWRLRAAGWQLRYVPQALMETPKAPPQGSGGEGQLEAHDAQANAQLALADKITTNLLLRLRFGTDTDVADWQRLFEEMTGNVSTTPEMEQRFCTRMAVLKKQWKAHRAYYHACVEHSGFAPLFTDFSPAFQRLGGQYNTVLPQGRTPVTVLIRAYQRPELLALTLESLRWQTYPFFRVLVAEDGATPVCKAVCDAAAQWLDLTYLPLCADAGRCEAGNVAVRAAETEYVCFLDEDDYFFADHLETMMGALEAHPQCELLFACSVEGACEAQVQPHFTRLWNNSCRGLTREDFFNGNPVAIQSALFTKSLYERCGGLDSALDAWEDWDLWLRCVLKAPFAVVEKATSLYRVPAEKALYEKRTAHFDSYRAVMQPRLAAYAAQAGLPADTAERWARQAQQADKTAAAQKTEEEQEHLLALRAAARQVSAAKGWRLAAPLRALTGGRHPEWFGPQPVAFDTADEQALNRFIFGARTSVFWRRLRR